MGCRRLITFALASLAALFLASPALAAPVNNSLPVISGNPWTTFTLTTTNGSWSGSGPITYTYQWQGCAPGETGCMDIPLSTNSTRSIPNELIGGVVRVKVTATDSSGSTTKTSAPTSVVLEYRPPVNTAAPAVSGTLRTGETLTVSDGSWSGEASTYTYQWISCDSNGFNCSDISGQTASSYTIPSTMFARTVKARVTATNYFGSASETSSATGLIEGAPHNLILPSLFGTPEPGNTISGADGMWDGTTPITYTHQWLRCNLAGDSCSAISGQTSIDHVVTEEDRGYTLRLRVTASNVYGSANQDSAATSPVPSAPVNNSSPALSGEARIGEVLTTSDGNWLGYPVPGFTYQWLRCNASGASCLPIANETSSTYTLAAEDVGVTVRARVVATNSEGSASKESSPSSVVLGPRAPPSNITSPSVSGSPQVGVPLTAVDGTWAGDPAPLFTYLWLRCNSVGDNCLPAGVTASSLTPAPEDEGATFKVQVTATNSEGSDMSESLASAPVAPGDSAPVNTDIPSISGQSQSGQTLTASPGSWSGYPAPVYSYQWERSQNAANPASWSVIDGADSASYTASSQDMSYYLRVKVTATNSGGSVSEPSYPTARVRNLERIDAPTVSGTPEVGQILEGTVGNWSAYPTPTYGYQWSRCDQSGLVCQAISGADSLSYTVSGDDIGYRLLLRVTATNSAGSLTSDSDPTGLVPTPPVAPSVTAAPSVSGTAQQGQTLEASSGLWDGTLPIAYFYQWVRCQDGSCTDIDSEVGTSYTLSALDVGATVKVRVRASNSAGFSDADSLETAVVIPPPAAPSNTARPALSGTAQQGQVLSLTDGSWSGDPTITFTYQWLRCSSLGADCTPIDAEVASSYTLSGDDVGFTVRGRVWASNDAGSTSEDTDPSALVAPPDSLPSNSLAPEISGTPESGQSLSVSSGSWSGYPAPDYTYEWLRCVGDDCTAIAGEDKSSYLLGDADLGFTIKARVTATNSSGSASATSASLGPVGSVPQLSSAPSVSGTPEVGQPLSTSDGTWTGYPSPDYSYQWFACQGEDCNPITGATESTYTPTRAYLSLTIKAQVTASNSVGATSTFSLATDPVSGPPVNTAPASVSGEARVGQTLTALNGTWTGYPALTFSHQWFYCEAGGGACQPIVGAEDASYLVEPAYLGKTIKVRVNALNASGDAFSDSDPTAAVAAQGTAPSVTTRPEVSGTTQSGESLTTTLGTWTGEPQPELSVQWLRCAGVVCLPIDEAIQQSYLLTAEDEGFSIRSRVTALNSEGIASSESDSTAVVDPPDSAPSNTSLPVVSGTAEAGGTLSASDGAWDGFPAPGFTYQWLRCNTAGEECLDIEGETESTYALTRAELSHTFKVRVTALNRVTSADATSLPSAPVTGAPQNSSRPVVSGNPEVGQTLSASDGSWTSYPEPVFTYQWFSCNLSGDSCNPIPEATDSSYTLTESELGSTILVRVIASGSVTADSLATGEVTPEPSAPVNTAAPVLSGTPEAGQALSTSIGSWSGYPSPGYQYRWLRCVGDDCDPIAGEEESSYQLTGADVGFAIRSRVIATNSVGQASQESLSSSLVTPAPALPSVTAPPVVSGQAAVGQTLSGSDGSWAGYPAPGFTYQWLRCDVAGASCNPVTDEDNPTYLLTSEDSGMTFRIRVTATNGSGSAEATSEPSEPVTEPLSNIVLPSVPGVPQAGNTISALSGSWDGYPGPGFEYRWQRCDSDGDNCIWVSALSDDPAYSVLAADAGYRLRVWVRAYSSINEVTLYSGASEVVTLAPQVVSPPSVSGSDAVGSTLSVSTGSWAGYPSPVLSYQWLRCTEDDCDPIPEATEATYSPVRADAGHPLKARVTATNSVGSASQNSAATNPVSAPPLADGPPVISGTVRSGQTLSLEPLDWGGYPEPTYAYAWESCQMDGSDCQPISSSSSAALSDTEVGRKVRVTVTATNAMGTDSEPSAFTAQVSAAPQPPSNQSPPSVSGTPEVGRSLTGADGSWSGEAPLLLSRQWMRCNPAGDVCLPVSGAESVSYTLTSGDVGSRMAFRVTAENDLGSLTVTSLPTSQVVGAQEIAAPAITSSPAAVSRTASLSFTGLSGASFECSLDQAAWAACQSPWAPQGLSDGDHSMRVRQAKDGVTSPSAEAKFRLDRTAPEAPSIISAPQLETPVLAAEFEFTGEEGASFECRYDQDDFAPCQSPVSRKLDKGKHSFSVRQTDAAGNAGPEASHEWTITSGKGGNGSGGVILTPQLDDRVEVSGGASTSARIGCQVSGAEIESCQVDAYVYLTQKSRRKWGFTTASRRVRTVIGSGEAKAKEGQGTVAVTVKFNARGRRLLERARGPRKVRFSMSVELKDALPLRSSKRASVVPRRQLVLPSGGMFHSGKSAPSAGGRKFISSLAGRLPSKMKSITCTGYTDNQGPSSFNYQLGLDRAQAVCKLMKKSGIKASFRVVSRGEASPRASNKTVRGRALNRRVEISLRYR